MTPVLSVAAFQASETLVVVEPVERKLPGVVGASPSGAGGHAFVEAFSDACPERLPAASAASTASAYVVPHARPVKVYVVPVGVAIGAPSRYAP